MAWRCGSSRRRGAPSPRYPPSAAHPAGRWNVAWSPTMLTIGTRARRALCKIGQAIRQTRPAMQQAWRQVCPPFGHSRRQHRSPRPSNRPSTQRMPGMRSSAATKVHLRGARIGEDRVHPGVQQRLHQAFPHRSLEFAPVSLVRRAACLPVLGLRQPRTTSRIAQAQEAAHDHDDGALPRTDVSRRHGGAAHLRVRARPSSMRDVNFGGRVDGRGLSAEADGLMVFRNWVSGGGFRPFHRSCAPWCGWGSATTGSTVPPPPEHVA